MRQFSVTGMSCAACSARVEKAVSAVAGVQSCSVSLLTNSMGVTGGKDSEIIRAVEEAGYGCSLKTEDGMTSVSEDDLADRDTPKLKKRLIASLFFVVVLMYFSMGHKMFGWPVPDIFEENDLAFGLVQMILALTVMIINRKFFINGFKGLIHRAPNMDTLVALGSAAGFIYSAAIMSHSRDLYFESSAMILALITVGKMLEARSKGRTTDALKGLIRLAPVTAVVERNGVETEIAARDVKIGDIFIVRPGQSIPVDGIVLSGRSAVNESALTGESVPADKEPGDSVSAATINTSGFLRCRAVAVGSDTTISRIIRMVSDAAATKAPIAKIADRVSGVFVPAVICIALVVTWIWMAVGRGAGFALARGISVLVISCPCALGLATPVAIMVGNGMGAKKSVLFKTASSLEELGKTDIVVLDKTGTVTSGHPVVTDIVPAYGIPSSILLYVAASLEKKSEHPMALAVVDAAAEEEIEAGDVTDFQALTGSGLTASLDGALLFGGNLKFISDKVPVSQDVREAAELLASQGKTPLLFARNSELLGIIAAADPIKGDSAEAVEMLEKLGICTVMLTGDNRITAQAVAEQAGIENVVAGVLPQDKAGVVRKLQQKGRVMMVGDGINDAPALTVADSGVAIGAGTDVAIDAADVVLMNSRLSDVCSAIRLSRKTLKTIKQNLFWAFIYNAICIPVAAGAFVKYGLTLNPMIGAAAMSCSSFFVISNALRLNFFRMDDGRKDKGQKGKEIPDVADIIKEIAESQVKKMNKTITIEGMMCHHCEKAVRQALECLPGVESASADHETGLCTVVMTEDIDNEILKAAVEDEDFKVISIA